MDKSAALETGIPHSARVWNYWLGGKDNFPADRQVGDQPDGSHDHSQGIPDARRVPSRPVVCCDRLVF